MALAIDEILANDPKIPNRSVFLLLAMESLIRRYQKLPIEEQPSFDEIVEKMRELEDRLKILEAERSKIERKIIPAEFKPKARKD